MNNFTTKKLKPLRSISEPGIPMHVVQRLLEACDLPPRKGRSILVVEMDGSTFTVAIDHKRNTAMIVRGIP